jgi:hypothetical protein
MGKYKNWEKAAFWSADTDEGKIVYSILTERADQLIRMSRAA